MTDLQNAIRKDKGSTDIKDGKKKVPSEICECGGTAKFIHWDKDDKRIPILRCNRCGDTFEASENSWRTLRR